MQDLSDRANTGFPSYSSSMAGGNTTTAKGPFQLEGSTSEQTADVPTHDTPDLTVGDAYSATNRVHGDAPSSGSAWTTVQGVTPRG